MLPWEANLRPREGAGEEEGERLRSSGGAQLKEHRRRLEPLPAGRSSFRGKGEDDFGQTECTENWILQPLTLLLGPL